METSQQTEHEKRSHGIPSDTTRLTFGGVLRPDNDSVLYAIVAWPSETTVEVGVARSAAHLHMVLQQQFRVAGDTILPIAMAAVVVGFAKQRTEDWFGAEVPVRWVDITKALVGKHWTISTRANFIIVRTLPNPDRALINNLAQLANVVLNIEQSPAVPGFADRPQPEETSRAWKALEAGYEGARAARAQATADALKQPTARELEQQRRYREILRETLLVEAFRVLLPQALAIGRSDPGVRSLLPDTLAMEAMEYVDALMAKAFESREVDRG